MSRRGIGGGAAFLWELRIANGVDRPALAPRSSKVGSGIIGHWSISEGVDDAKGRCGEGL